MIESLEKTGSSICEAIANDKEWMAKGMILTFNYRVRDLSDQMGRQMISRNIARKVEGNKLTISKNDYRSRDAFPLLFIGTVRERNGKAEIKGCFRYPIFSMIVLLFFNLLIGLMTVDAFMAVTFEKRWSLTIPLIVLIYADIFLTIRFFRHKKQLLDLLTASNGNKPPEKSK